MIYSLTKKNVMKKLIVVFCLAALASSCNNEKKEPAAESKETTETKPAVPLSLPASYSSSFEMGNPAYTAMVVQGSWKDWQDNTMDNMKSWVADTITAYMSDNSMARGVDSIGAKWKRNRANYTSVKDNIDAAMAVRSTDKKEDWVLVWATDYSTDKKGKTDTARVMETWRINKDGKADLLLQFDRHARKQ
jgi:hypothetical protein